MIALANAKSAIMLSGINGSPPPEPKTRQAPVTSQTRASGTPISQNVRQRAIWPVASRARKVMDIRLPAAALMVPAKLIASVLIGTVLIAACLLGTGQAALAQASEIHGRAYMFRGLIGL